MTSSRQLIGYIAPTPTATCRLAASKEPYLPAEKGLTVRWYQQKLGIDFGKQWHATPTLRNEGVKATRVELRRRFSDMAIGGIDWTDSSTDLMTGTLGTYTIAAIYGLPVVYSTDNWPDGEHQYLDKVQLETLTPHDLKESPVSTKLMSQLDTTTVSERRIEGFINGQGVLTNAPCLHGKQLFLNMLEKLHCIRRSFDCVYSTMIEAARSVHARQEVSGIRMGFFTISNCPVNMISRAQYRDLVLPFDQKIARPFGCVGIHNCVWIADPDSDHYAEVPHVGYIDMGLHSDLVRTRELFPQARRALMYTRMNPTENDIPHIRQNLERIAPDYGLCDVVVGDIEPDTRDKNVRELAALCGEFSRRYEPH